jgi:superfamily II DNA/RNA helicase
MPDKIEELAKSLLKNPIEVKIAVSKPAERIQQQAYICYETQKLGIIKNIFQAGDLKRVIIFSGKKTKVKRICGALGRLGINSGEMHSDLSQAERDEMMYRFKSGQIDVLIATDILSRGIDIDDITMVINYDVPHDPEDYVHRIGRTARADRAGSAITFVSPEDFIFFQQIERFLEKEVEKAAMPEELGEAPEYKISKKSTSAKNRRRKDRDNNAHRHKPHNDGQRAKVKGQRSKADKADKAEKAQPVATPATAAKKKKHRKKAVRQAPESALPSNSTKYAVQEEMAVTDKGKGKGLKAIIKKPLNWLKKHF